VSLKNILRNMENKSLTQEAVKGVVVLGSWNTLTKFFSLANSFIVIYLLSVYEYGIYVLIMSVISISEIFLFESMDQLMITDVIIEKSKEQFQKARLIFQEYYQLKVILGVVLFLILLFGSHIIADYFGNRSISIFIKLASLLVLSSAIQIIFAFYLRVNRKFNLIGIFAIIQEIIRLILLLSVFFFFTPGVAKILAVTVLTTYIIIFIRLIVLFKEIKKWFIGFKLRFKNLIIYQIFKQHGKWRIATSFLTKFQKDIRLWLIQLFIGTEAVAIYNFGRNLYLHLDSVLPINKVILQLIPNIITDKERLKRTFIYATKYLTLVHIFMALGGLIAGPIFVYFLFPDYLYSIPVFYILLLMPCSFQGLFKVTDNILFSLREQRFLSLSLILRATITTLVSLIMLPLFGIYGIAMERVITLFFTTIIFTRKTLKSLGMKFKELFEIFRVTSEDKVYFKNMLKIINLKRLKK